MYPVECRVSFPSRLSWNPPGKKKKPAAQESIPIETNTKQIHPSSNKARQQTATQDNTRQGIKRKGKTRYILANQSGIKMNPFDARVTSGVTGVTGAAEVTGVTGAAEVAGVGVEGSLWKRWRTNKMIPPNLAPRSRTIRHHLNELIDNDTNPSRNATASQMEAEVAAAVVVSENVKVEAQSTLLYQKPPDSPPSRGSINDINNSTAEPEQIVTPKVQEDEYSFFEQQTPPSFSPLPVMVSAKRLGKEVRRSHSKRRRPRSFQTTNKENNDAWNSMSNNNNNNNHDDNNNHSHSYWTNYGITPSTASTASTVSTSTSTSAMEVDELALNLKDLSPEARANHYWTLCYGNQERQQKSFSANRAPPVKSWYVTAIVVAFPFHKHKIAIQYNTIQYSAVQYSAVQSVTPHKQN